MTFDVRPLELDDWQGEIKGLAAAGGKIGGGKHQQKISFLTMVKVV